MAFRRTSDPIMDDDEFNFYRIIKGEKKVALPALKELFETLWNKNYPETPWTHDATSVNHFELTEKKYFQNSIDGLSKEERNRKCDQRRRLQNTFRDKKWKEYEWDVSKFVYALVDSKMFELDETDEEGKPLSEHIVNIRDIRNETAHLTTSACKKDHSELTLQTLADHIKVFELVGLNVSPYLEGIDKIKSEQKPVSRQEISDLRFEFDNLKISEQLYLEREKRLTMFEEQKAEREKHQAEIMELQSKLDIQTTIADKYSKENEKLKVKLEKQQKALEEYKCGKLEEDNNLHKFKTLMSKYEKKLSKYAVKIQKLQSEKISSCSTCSMFSHRTLEEPISFLSGYDQNNRIKSNRAEKNSDPDQEQTSDTSSCTSSNSSSSTNKSTNSSSKKKKNKKIR